MSDTLIKQRLQPPIAIHAQQYILHKHCHKLLFICILLIFELRFCVDMQQATPINWLKAKIAPVE